MFSAREWAQFKAMFRKNWLQTTAEKKKNINELIFNAIYGVGIGFALHYSLIPGSEIQELGYLIVILTAPMVFQQSCVFMLTELTKDRANKMRESLRIMGLSDFTYQASFFFMRTVWVSITSFINGIAIYVPNTGIIGFGDALCIVLAEWLLATAMLAISMLISNFFTDFKFAAISGPLILFIPTGVASLGVIQPPCTWFAYLFWLPIFPFEVIICNIFQPGVNLFAVSVTWAWIAALILPFAYFGIHLWVAAIMPDSYGVSKPCCFCFSKPAP